METLLIFSVIFLFIATTAVLCYGIHLQHVHIQDITESRLSRESASSSLEEAKRLISTIKDAHNDLVLKTVDTAKKLEDLKLLVEMSRMKR